MTEKKDLNKVVEQTKKNMEFDKKHPPIIKTKDLIEQGVYDKDTVAVSYDPTTKLFVNKDRTIAFKNYNEASNYNKSIGVDVRPITPPKEFNNNDRSTYPSNQRSAINTWSALVEDAKRNPNDPNSKETKKVILREYNNPNKRKTLGENELKLIGKHKSQLKEIKPVEIPDVSLDYKRFKPEPSPSFDEFVAERRKHRQYGLNEQLVSDKLAIKKITDWVLGKKVESEESMNEIKLNKEEKSD